MKVKKIIKKCNQYQDIRILSQHDALIWQGYALDLIRGYPHNAEVYFISESEVLGIKTIIIKHDNCGYSTLDIYIKIEDKK